MMMMMMRNKETRQQPHRGNLVIWNLTQAAGSHFTLIARLIPLGSGVRFQLNVIGNVYAFKWNATPVSSFYHFSNKELTCNLLT